MSRGSPTESAATAPLHPRRILSFVRRDGRLTAAQSRALEQLLPRYGVESGATIDPVALFGAELPVTLEIGFGDGESLAEMAAADPQRGFLGIEVHRPGVGHLLLAIEQLGLENVRLLERDAVEVVRDQLPANALDRVQIFFPDPWPKKRHHKRRLIQSEFVEQLARVVRVGGLLHLATDWPPYAEQMLEVINGEASFRNLAPAGGFSPRPARRPQTKFERRGERKGHLVSDLLFERIDTVP